MAANRLPSAPAPLPTETSSGELDTIAGELVEATAAWSGTPLVERARALNLVADALAAEGEALVAVAAAETGLSPVRLNGELARTVVQLRLFADVVAEGAFLDVRIDEADPDFALGSRPDLRRFNGPVGPALNFAASNFPFAFSVAGGDTAAALAAGCAVVVKRHSGHPRLSERTAHVVTDALREAGAPRGVFALIGGQSAGVAMLRDPRIRVATFTGSQRAGRLLAGIAADRPRPIPFFGELGSVNPVFVTAGALAERAAEIASGYAGAVGGSAGQLCTKPGFLFLPRGHGLDGELARLAGADPEHRMLHPAIAEGYQRRREAILSTRGVETIVEGTFRMDDDGQGWVTPTIARVSTEGLERQRSTLLDEAFGPLSIVVEYDDDAGLAAAAERLFEGNLAGAVHVAAGEDSPAVRALLDWAAQSCGRVIVNGWPTGVAVTPAMHHGGPWPATTNDAATSVGTASIARFLRPVAYQGVDQKLLPPPLRDDNPWSVPQQRNRAGLSRSWGSRYADGQQQKRIQGSA